MNVFTTAPRQQTAAPMAAGSPTTMLSTPSGMPARRASSASASAVSGVASAGFSTTCKGRNRCVGQSSCLLVEADSCCTALASCLTLALDHLTESFAVLCRAHAVATHPKL